MKISVLVLLSLAFAYPASATCNKDILSITAWSIKPVNTQTNELTVTMTYNGAKPSKMIDATFGFTDALGGRIAAAAVNRDLKVEPGESFTQVGKWGANTFERLLTLERDDVQAETCVRSILLRDGSKETFN